MPKSCYVPKKDLRDLIVSFRIKKSAAKKIDKYCKVNNISRSTALHDLVLAHLDSFEIPKE